MSVPWKGWKKIAPSKKQQKTMFRRCGKKCFLGKQSYPICAKHTCKINRKGVYAAYIRAREYKSKRGNKTIANKAKRILGI